MKQRIKQVIVVEGHHDTDTLKKYYDCDTIETGGSSLDDATLKFIAKVQKVRGVIVFTDPDSPGNRIRSRINQAVPGCLNAFVEKKDARTDKKVGVEHASKAALDQALGNLVVIDEHPSGDLTMTDLYLMGFTGTKDAAALREYVGSVYHIGNGNARTMAHRLRCLGITKQQLKETIAQWKNAK